METTIMYSIGETRWDIAEYSYDTIRNIRPLRVVRVSPETYDEVIKVYPILEICVTKSEGQYIRTSYYRPDLIAIAEIGKTGEVDGVEFINLMTPVGQAWPNETAFVPSSNNLRTFQVVYTAYERFVDLFDEMFNEAKRSSLGYLPDEVLQKMAGMYLINKGISPLGFSEYIFENVNVKELAKVLEELPDHPIRNGAIELLIRNSNRYE